MAEHGPPTPVGHDQAEGAREPDIINFSGVLKFGVGLLIFAAVVHLVLAGVFSGLLRRTERAQPPLSPVARQQREQQQRAAEKRVRETNRSETSPPLPQPPLVYERFRAVPGPRLQVNDEADLAALRAEEAKKLQGYHWVDRKAGVVRIPIEQAMRLLADPKRSGAPGVRVKNGGTP
jgi:hypothetical protein